MLDGGGAAHAQEEDGAADDWRPVCPVPEDAPEPTFRHLEHGEVSEHWAYLGVDGRLLGYVVRFYVDTGESRELQHTYCSGPGGRCEWRWANFPKPLPLYHLDQLARAGVAALVTVSEEGADAAARLFPDFAVTSCPGGLKNAREAGWRCMVGQEVAIWPANDAEGERYAEHVVRECKRAGAKAVSVVKLPAVFPDGWSLIDDAPDGWEADGLLCLIRGAEVRASNAHEAVNELNQRHAVVPVGGKCVILNEGRDPVFERTEISFSSAADFKTRYQNRRVRVGRKQEELGTVWLRHADRRQYEGIVFAPNESCPGFFNLWTDFAVEPKPGDCSLYLAHLRDNVAGGVEEVFNYIIAWTADAVQNPAKRPGTAIVLRGRQGVGKGICCSQFGKLFGQHFVQVTSSRHLTGNFNAHLKDALIVFADEAFWAGDKSAEGVLKGMVTEEEIHIELKGKDTIRVRNHIRLMIASNHDWVVPAGLEERRFFVVDVGDACMQDRSYFKAIVEQMENGGREALLHHLLNYDLSEVDLAVFPQTGALREQKFHSMSAVQTWWFDRLSDGSVIAGHGKWPESALCEQVQNDFVAHAKRTGERRRATATELGIELRRLVPGLSKRKKPWGAGRRYHYLLPQLAECRAAFDQLTRSRNPWPEDEEEASAPPCPTQER